MPIAARLLPILALLAAAPLAGAEPPAAGPLPVSVQFSAALEQRLSEDYGAGERDTLVALVTEEVSQALARGHPPPELPADARIEVLVRDARPSHPTRQQTARNPSLDPLRSASLGGAELRGRVVGPYGQVFAEVRYSRFAPDFATASVAGDPWADARLAIERFAAQLARESAAAH